MLPLEVLEPYPLVIKTVPPLRSDVAPADNFNAPPVPLLPEPTVIITVDPCPEPEIPEPM
jgi:hypothetical protein